MSGTTSVFGIRYPTSGDNVSPLETVFQTMADDVDYVLAQRVPSDWTAWSPSYAGITVGNGTVEASYMQLAKLVVCHYRLTWGSTTSFSGTPQVILPVASYGYALNDTLGDAAFYDSSVGSASREPGGVFYSSSDEVFFVRASTTSGTVNATSPFTWATGDTLSFTATYRAA